MARYKNTIILIALNSALVISYNVHRYNVSIMAVEILAAMW